jgi:hypothetical protein
MRAPDASAMSQGTRERREPRSPRRSRQRETDKYHQKAADRRRGQILPTCVGPNAIIAPQVAFDYVIVHGNEGLVRALTTLDLRLPTDTADPFIVACRRIPDLPVLWFSNRTGTRLSGPQRAAETARFCRPPMSCWSHHRVEGVRLAASLGAAPNATRASSARHPVRQAVAGSKQFLPVLPLLACPRLAKRRLHKLNGPLATDRGRPTPRASVLVDGRN